MQQHEKNRQKKKKKKLGGAPYIRETLFRFTACCKFGSLPCIFGVSQHVTERFHLPLFVTDKWVKCYCELIFGLASLIPLQPTVSPWLVLGLIVHG